MASNQQSLEMIARLRDEATPILKNLNREMERFGRSTGLRETRDRFKELDTSVTGAARGLRDALGPAMGAFGFGALGVGAAVAGMVVGLNKLGETHLVIGRLSSTTRTSRENLGRMQEAGEKLGISVEQMQGAYANFARTVAQTTGGPMGTAVGQAQQLLNTLRTMGPVGREIAGSYQAFVRMNPNDTWGAFKVLMEGIGRLEPFKQVEALAAINLPAELVGFFEKLKTAKSPFTEEDSKRLEKIGELTRDLSKEFTNLFNTVISGFAPLAITALSGVNTATTDWIANMKQGAVDMQGIKETFGAAWADWLNNIKKGSEDVERIKGIYNTLTLEKPTKQEEGPGGEGLERRRELLKKLEGETIFGPGLPTSEPPPFIAPPPAPEPPPFIAPALPVVPAPAVEQPAPAMRRGRLRPYLPLSGLTSPAQAAEPGDEQPAAKPFELPSYDAVVDKLRSIREAVDPLQLARPDMSTEGGFARGLIKDVAKYAPWASRAGNVRLTPSTGLGAPRMRVDNVFRGHDFPKMTSPLDMPAPHVPPKGMIVPGFAMEPTKPTEPGEAPAKLSPEVLDQLLRGIMMSPDPGPMSQRGPETQRQDWTRLDRSLKTQTGVQKVEGDASITVDVNAPKGTHVDASAGGMFRRTQINRSQQMGFGDYAGEAYPSLESPSAWGR